MSLTSIKKAILDISPFKNNEKEVIGVAFGSGGARGWSHIGAILALEELGIKPEVVTGTSIGAVAAAIYAADSVDKVVRFAEEIKQSDVASILVEFRLPHKGGLIEGVHAMEIISKFVPNIDIESMGIKYGAVATDLHTEEEVQITSGNILDAIRASISIPGIFVPAKLGSRYLVDGALVNPVPVKLARKLGATKVIAINVSSELHEITHNDNPQDPSLLDVMSRTWRLAERIAVESSLEKQPPDILIEPISKNFSTFDFMKSRELIAVGYEMVKRALSK